MEGIHYVTDDHNRRIAVQIDLQKYMLVAELRMQELKGLSGSIRHCPGPVGAREGRGVRGAVSCSNSSCCFCLQR